MIQANPGFSKIYVVASAYVGGKITGSVNVFDVAGKKFDTTPFVKDISGISGIAVNPKNSDVYVFASQSTTGVGLMKIYSQTGDFVKDIEVGASPNGALFLN
jgi:DNA-binding beta-propeller fold protein YncE